MAYPTRKPCKNCPFLKTAVPGWIGEKRATQLVNGIMNDGIMHCHKTLDYSAGTGEGEETDKTRICAGSILLHVKAQRPNRLYRLIDHAVAGGSLVVDSVADFITLHTPKND